MYDHRLTVFDDLMSNELLTDDPAAGFEPMLESTASGHYVSAHVRTNRLGQRNYTVVPGSTVAGSFRWNPTPAVYDVQLSDFSHSGTSVYSLIRDGQAAAIGPVGEAMRYVASVDDAGNLHELQFDIESDGLVTWLRDTISVPGALPITREQRVICATTLDGMRLPAETHVSVRNPNLSDVAANVHVIEATGITRQPGLQASDLALEIDPHSARIAVYRPDGVVVDRTYGSDGELIEERITGGPELADSGAVAVARDSVAWRKSIPIGAGVLGVLASVALHCFGKRRA